MQKAGSGEGDGKGNKDNKKLLAITMVLLVVIGIMGVVIYQLMNRKGETTTLNDGRVPAMGLVMNDEIDEKVRSATFTTDMNMIWTFPSGSRVSDNAIIGNSEYNAYEVYFDLFLDGEERTLIYTSPLIPVGVRMDKLELDEVLPDGYYDAICTFHLMDDEDDTRELSKVSLNVTLMVGG